MKKTIAIAIIILLSTKSYSQISKGNWLIGGDVKFNYTANTVMDSKYSSTTLNINPQLGYFILDKFAVGLRPSLGFVFASGASNHVTSYSVGPYARYYFLDETRMLNLFLQGDYA